MQRVLVALDGSDHARRALDLACAIAARFEAELLAVHVLSRKPLSEAERKMAAVEYHTEIAEGFDPSVLIDARSDSRLLGQRLVEQAAETGRRFRRAMGERLLEEAKGRASETGVSRTRTFLENGDPGERILRLIEREDVDLVVMGRRGRPRRFAPWQCIAQGRASRELRLPHREVSAPTEAHRDDERTHEAAGSQRRDDELSAWAGGALRLRRIADHLSLACDGGGSLEARGSS